MDIKNIREQQAPSHKEALIICLVDPQKATAVRSEIIKAVLPELLKQPEKAMFPKSNMR